MCQGWSKALAIWGGEGKEIFYQLASHFPQFEQLSLSYVIKSWSIYDHFFIEIDQIVGQKDIINRIFTKNQTIKFSN